MIQLRATLATATVVTALMFVSGCSGSGSGAGTGVNHPVPPVSTPGSSVSMPVLATLTVQQTIGSTVPAGVADVNPYGLDIARGPSGPINTGDLVVCDFNDPSNVQGTGTEIVALHPVAGSTPTLIANDSSLTGCDALATAPSGPIWAAAFSANDNPIFSGDGTLISTLGTFSWQHPFGEAFVPAIFSSTSAFYVSDAGDGSLVRVSILPGPAFTFTIIATGFPVNGGAPGGILGPSGLNYQPNGDILYVVDGTNNALYAIDNVSSIPANGIVVQGGSGLSFGGPAAADAHVVFSGAPLNGPISSAILFNGNIVLANTLDPNGQNLMIEISSSGKLLGTMNVDSGAAGALFGMVATGTSAATEKLYFNDDNDNTVKVLSQ